MWDCVRMVHPSLFTKCIRGMFGNGFNVFVLHHQHSQHPMKSEPFTHGRNVVNVNTHITFGKEREWVRAHYKHMHTNTRWRLRGESISVVQIRFAHGTEATTEKKHNKFLVCSRFGWLFYDRFIHLESVRRWKKKSTQTKRKRETKQRHNHLECPWFLVLQSHSYSLLAGL